MQNCWHSNTAVFMKMVPSVYTLLVNTIRISHSTQVAGATIHRKNKNIFLSFCLSIHIFICLSVFLFVCHSVFMSFCFSFVLSFCLSVFISFCLSLSLHLTSYLSIYYVCLYFNPPSFVSSFRAHFLAKKPL